jgi:hypothetical protein
MYTFYSYNGKIKRKIFHNDISTLLHILIKEHIFTSTQLNIKMNLTETGYKAEDWTHMVQSKVHWWALVSTVTHIFTNNILGE